MSIALVLAAHGSHIISDTARVVWGYVDALRRQGVADEITATFWKEQPEFNMVLRSITSDVVVVVPLFTASGYFSKRVIPSAMGLTGPITKRDNQTIHYTDTLGTHPRLSDIVFSIVTETIDSHTISPADAAVAILAHGTKRSESTRLTTQRQVKKMTDAQLVTEVVDAYLDDEPDIQSVYHRTAAQNIIAVPFFLAQGTHATQDVPESLGIQYGTIPDEVNGRNVYYTQAIGTHPLVLDLILDLARQSGHPFTKKDSQDWLHMPNCGADEILAKLNDDTHLTFGELAVTSSVIYPKTSSRITEFKSLSDLRTHIRENPFRPLASASTLPADWQFIVDELVQIPAIIETVYPTALADWACAQTGTFRIIDNEPTRQVQDAERFVGEICQNCVKHPTWFDTRVPAGSIPCPAPCNLWKSAHGE